MGMLSTAAYVLTMDVFGPIADNAGGIVEMSDQPESVRECTDALDAAGNTTAAIGKGFAIGSACLVGLALFGAFSTRVGMVDINILRPIVFAFIFIGFAPQFIGLLTSDPIVASRAATYMYWNFPIVSFMAVEYGLGRALCGRSTHLLSALAPF